MSKSFVILKEELTTGQLMMIRNHGSLISNNIEEYEKWVIEENSEYICGYTEKDCINMFGFFSYCVGLNNDIVIWGSGLHSLNWVNNGK